MTFVNALQYRSSDGRLLRPSLTTSANSAARKPSMVIGGSDPGQVDRSNQPLYPIAKVWPHANPRVA